MWPGRRGRARAARRRRRPFLEMGETRDGAADRSIGVDAFFVFSFSLSLCAARSTRRGSWRSGAGVLPKRSGKERRAESRERAREREGASEGGGKQSSSHPSRGKNRVETKQTRSKTEAWNTNFLLHSHSGGASASISASLAAREEGAGERAAAAPRSRPRLWRPRWGATTAFPLFRAAAAAAKKAATGACDSSKA